MRGNVSRCVCAVAAGVVVAGISQSLSAVPIAKIQPTEDISDDVFTYQFAGAGFNIAPDASDTNLDTDTVGPLGSPIGSLLGTSRSETTTHVINPATGEFADPADGGVDVDTGHDGNSWLKFDLGGVAVPAGQRIIATLNLYALDGFGATGGAFANPSPGDPVTTDVFAAGGPWVEQDLKWTNQDPIVPLPGTEVDSVVQTGVERWVGFDVTPLVVDWLAGAPNDGVVLSQRDVVPSAVGGGLTGVVSSLYASSAWDDDRVDSLRPFLLIEAVPEPVTAMFSMMAIGSLGLAARRRSA